MNLFTSQLLYNLLELSLQSRVVDTDCSPKQQLPYLIFPNDFPIMGIYLLTPDFSITQCLFAKPLLKNTCLDSTLGCLMTHLSIPLEVFDESRVETHPNLYLLPPFYLKNLNLNVKHSLILLGATHHYWLIQNVHLGCDRKSEIRIPNLQLYDIKDWITKHFNDPPRTLAYWARRIGSNETYLKKDFKKIFGCSIYQLQLYIKLEKAHELLTARTRSIHEIAFDCGFNSYNSFYKAFVKRFGYCPKNLTK